MVRDFDYDVTVNIKLKRVPWDGWFENQLLPKMKTFLASEWGFSEENDGDSITVVSATRTTGTEDITDIMNGA